MENDLRGKLPYKHLDEFLRWFEEGHGRESAQECLQRELREEMAEVGLTLMSDELTGVRFVHVRHAREGLGSYSAETYVQFRFFDVFDIGTEFTQGQELLRKIEAQRHSRGRPRTG